MNLKKRFYLSLIVLSFFTCGVFAQTNADVMFSRNAKSSVTKYDEIDSYVKSLSIPVSMSYKDAVTKITAKSKTDKEMARAIFDFLAFNISYNTAKAKNRNNIYYGKPR